MTIKEFTSKAKAILTTELDAWKNGDKTWNVNNQFNESILESALESLNDISAARAFRLYGNGNYGVMDIANFIATFAAPELESAWTR